MASSGVGVRTRALPWCGTRAVLERDLAVWLAPGCPTKSHRRKRIDVCCACVCVCVRREVPQIARRGSIYRLPQRPDFGILPLTQRDYKETGCKAGQGALNTTKGGCAACPEQVAACCWLCPKRKASLSLVHFGELLAGRGRKEEEYKERLTSHRPAIHRLVSSLGQKRKSFVDSSAGPGGNRKGCQRGASATGLCSHFVNGSTLKAVGIAVPVWCG